MAFWSVCNEEAALRLTSDGLKEWMKGYCDWCWGHGYGNCDNCKKYKNHLLFLCKMKEYKERSGENGDVNKIAH